MIYIKRPKELPFSLSTDAVKKLSDEAGNFYQRTDRSQVRYKGTEDADEVERDIIQSMLDPFQYKCSYCEQEVNFEDRQAVADRFRPRRSALTMDNVAAPDHYYWLLYNWDNLFLSCSDCDFHKGKYFPVDGRRLRKGSKNVDKETNVLLDVCKDDPAKHIKYDTNGRMIGLDRRGQLTIEILKLNRPDLLARRKKAAERIRRSLKNFIDIKGKKRFSRTFIDRINNLLTTHSKEEFQGMYRYMLLEVLSANPDIVKTRIQKARISGDSASNDFAAMLQKLETYQSPGIQEVAPKVSKELRSVKNQTPPSPDRINLHKVVIHNFKNISDLTIELTAGASKESLASDTQSPWLFMLGENGSGKSSILKAIALTLAGQAVVDRLEIKAKDILQYHKESGFVKIYTQEGQQYRMTFDANRIQANAVGIGSYLLGYGSTRLMVDGNRIKRAKHKEKTRIENLFDPIAGLVNARDWLIELWRSTTKKDKVSFDRVAVVLKDLLNLNEKGEEGKIDYDLEMDEIVLRPSQGSAIPLPSLSDGYKITLALACDIMKTVNEQLKMDFGNVYALVLVDELGTHLHPRWKMRIVGALREAFPNIQFIVTSHEPLCLRGTKEKEVRVLQYDMAQKAIHMLEDLPDPSSFRVDQLLTSPFFGLHSVISPEREVVFREYYDLLQQPSLDDTQSQRLSELADEVRTYNHLGGSLREELVYYAVDKLLAKRNELGASKAINWKDMEAETIREVEKLWKQYDPKNELP
ncbi:MAG: AAA family ATPase [Bacteroidota bacterium]